MAQEIRIIGTSHISRKSRAQVERVIRELRPQWVCVELDAKRLAGLRSGVRRQLPAGEMVRRVGVQGYLFSVFAGWAQRKLGAQVGMNPGEEMLAAVTAAREVGAKLALVDQDIEVTLRRLRLTWRERLRLGWGLVKGLFGGGEVLEFDLDTVPKKSVIVVLMGQTRDRYPSLYRVLVTERNAVMARRVARIARESAGNVVVVLGAGHEDEVARLVQGLLRKTRVPEALHLK